MQPGRCVIASSGFACTAAEKHRHRPPDDDSRVSLCASAPLSDRYFPLTELATYAGLSRRTLQNYLVDPAHPLPFFKIGGKILVRQSDFDTWAAQFRVVRPAVDVGGLVDEIVTGLK